MRIGATLTTEFKALERAEANEAMVIPRVLDRLAFRLLFNYITRHALDLVGPEWERTKEAVDKQELDYGDYAPASCDCQLIARWGLPCRHFLVLSYLRGSEIPKSLFHPRWWINGPPVSSANWRPTEYTQTLPISPSRTRRQAPISIQNALTNSSLEALTARDALQGAA